MLADTTGSALTVTVVVAVPVQPCKLVPVTVYVAVETGVKATAFVTPLFQEYVKAPLPLRVIGEPAHTD